MSNAYPPGGPGYRQQPYQQGPYVQQPTFVYAGFWSRVLAIIIDALVIGLPLNFIAVALGIPMFSGDPMALVRAGGSLLAYQAIALIVNWLYFALLESSSWQGTLGKKALGIVVTDYAGQRLGFGQATGRYFAKLVSAIILGIGFLMVAFTQRKQGLHDMIASTLVVRRIG